jgi:HK97 family phage prohead protease
MAEFDRSVTAELYIRSAAQGGDGRTVHGITVPFDTPTFIEPGLTESFDRAAFNHQMGAIHRVPLFHGHKVHGGRHVGHLTMARSDPAGLYVEGRASRTQAGDEFLEMVKDGSLPHFSVGFRVSPSGSLMRGGVTHRVRADLSEVAGVPEGAYGDHAAIAGVRALTTAANGVGLVQPGGVEDPDHDADNDSALMDLLADCTPEECARLAQMAEQMVAEGSHVA